MENKHRSATKINRLILINIAIKAIKRGQAILREVNLAFLPSRIIRSTSLHSYLVMGRTVYKKIDKTLGDKLAVIE